MKVKRCAREINHTESKVYRDFSASEAGLRSCRASCPGVELARTVTDDAMRAGPLFPGV